MRHAKMHIHMNIYVDVDDVCTDWRGASGPAHQYTTWQNCHGWLKENLK